MEVHMLIKTRRFELDMCRAYLFLRVNLKAGRWETFRDWTGQGLSATSWEPTPA